MCKGVTIVKQGCKKCVTREGTCQLLKISKKMVVEDDKELIHKRCNCYTTQYTRGCLTVTVLEHMLIKCIFGVIVRDHPSLAVSAARSAFNSNFLWDHPHFSSNFVRPHVSFLVNF